METKEVLATLPAPPPATRFQKSNQEYINDNLELKKAFKEMQRFAKDKDQLSAFASAVRVIEALTGYPDLSAWVIGQFDLNF